MQPIVYVIHIKLDGKVHEPPVCVAVIEHKQGSITSPSSRSSAAQIQFRADKFAFKPGITAEKCPMYRDLFTREMTHHHHHPHSQSPRLQLDRTQDSVPLRKMEQGRWKWRILKYRTWNKLRSGKRLRQLNTLSIDSASVRFILMQNDFSCCDQLNLIVSKLRSYTIVTAIQAFPVIL